MILKVPYIDVDQCRLHQLLRVDVDLVDAWVVGNQLTILVGAVLIYHCWARCVRFWLGCTVMIGQAGHLSVGR